MNKRIVVVICIVVALMSFMGGMAYQYEDFIPIVEQSALQSKFHINFKMPVDIETAYVWLDWSIGYHQFRIDNEIFTDSEPEELHQKYVDMYKEIKVLFQELNEEYK